MFESFNEILNSDQHKIHPEQLYRKAESMALNTVYVVSRDAIVIDNHGYVFVDLDVNVYGNQDDCHDLENFLIEEFEPDPVLLVKTEDGYVIDASEVFDDVIDYHDSTRLHPQDEEQLGVVMAFVETRNDAETLYRMMQEKYDVDFEEQTNSLLAELASLQSSDED